MIWLKEITAKKPLTRIYNSYEITFPEAERRDKDDFLSLLERPEVYVYTIHNDLSNESVGYLVVWDLQEFHFIEHFEIFSEFRGKGLGEEVLRNVQEKYSEIVLETEAPEVNEISESRIQFYTRCGFMPLQTSYIQPAYRKDSSSVSMWLMMYGELSIPVDEVVDLIKAKVYPPQ